MKKARQTTLPSFSELTTFLLIRDHTLRTYMIRLNSPHDPAVASTAANMCAWCLPATTQVGNSSSDVHFLYVTQTQSSSRWALPSPSCPSPLPRPSRAFSRPPSCKRGSGRERGCGEAVLAPHVPPLSIPFHFCCRPVNQVIACLVLA